MSIPYPYIVQDGYGRIITTVDPYSYATYGNGMIYLYPYAWQEGDPLPPYVYVEDLGVGEWPPGAIGYHMNASRFIGIIDLRPWQENQPPRTYYPYAIPYMSSGGGTQEISLTAPSVITGHYRAKWKVRISDALADRPMYYQAVHFQRYGYNQGLLWEYFYFLTEEDVAAGWIDMYNPFEEGAGFSGYLNRSSVYAWTVSLRGNGLASLDVADSQAIFEIASNTWYIVELEAGVSETTPSGGFLRVTINVADGDAAGAAAATVTVDIIPPYETPTRRGTDGEWDMDTWTFTSLTAGFTEADLYQEITISGQRCVVWDIYDQYSIYIWGPGGYPDPGIGLSWEIAGNGPDALGFSAGGSLFQAEPWWADIDWVQVFGFKKNAIAQPDRTTIHEGWVTETLPIQVMYSPVTVRYFDTTATPARGTLNVYTLDGEILDPADDWNYVPDADTTRFSINRGDIDAVEVTYLNNPPSLRTRQTTPRISDPNYAHSHQIRDDNDIRGF